MADCDSCGENTATPPVCEDCRAEQVAHLTGVIGDGWQLSREQGAWLLAEVDRLRATLARRGEEYDGVRAALEIEYGIGKGLAAERDQLGAQVEALREHWYRDRDRALAAEMQVERVQALVDEEEARPGAPDSRKVSTVDLRAALDGEVPS
jgi:hypothetical protein